MEGPDIEGYDPRGSVASKRNGRGEFSAVVSPSQERPAQDLLAEVNRFVPAMRHTGAGALRRLTHTFRQRVAAGERLDDLAAEAFAAVGEAARRSLGLELTDMQIAAGAALCSAAVVEVKDGESRPVAALLPAYLYALRGDGVHVAALSEHLTRREAERARAVLGALGLDVGLVTETSSLRERRKAYAADVTYGSCFEFECDYLRDNLADLGEQVQRGMSVAIVDAADTVLVDFARAPVCLTAPSEPDVALFRSCADIAAQLAHGVHHVLGARMPNVAITAKGGRYIANALGIESFFSLDRLMLMKHMDDAIAAKEWFHRGEHYVVADGSVVFADHAPRSARDVRHAIEAKEDVEITDDRQPIATITVQDYFRRYDRLTGMTATATTVAAELDLVYGLAVVEVPPSKPVIRRDHNDVIYTTDDARLKALVDEVAARHNRGQPVVIGVPTTATVERVGQMLRDRGIEPAYLTVGPDFHDKAELAVMAQAGRRGAVTIISVMAGRGLDIPLGGDVEYLAEENLLRDGVDPARVSRRQWSEAFAAARRAIQPTVQAERERVLAAGGLAVLCSERGSSRRIDDWRRGLAGHRGEPGESKFFLSLDDELLRAFAGEVGSITGRRFPSLAEMPRSGRAATDILVDMQREAEAWRVARRAEKLPFHEVAQRQREEFYAWRRAIVEGRDHRKQVRRMLDNVVERSVSATVHHPVARADLDELWSLLRAVYPVRPTVDDVVAECGGHPEDMPAAFLVERLRSDAHKAYARRERKLGADTMRRVERHLILVMLQMHWREHLRHMDLLDTYSHVIADDASDPLTEYQRQARELYTAMLDRIERDVIERLFKIDI